MLEQVVKLLASERRRTPQEGHCWPFTEAYAHLIIANGFARLGDSQRAIALGEAAREVVGGSTDEVHSFLADAYFHRLECALAQRPRTLRYPVAIAAALGRLSNVARYKVGRILESSPTLSVNGLRGTDDAIGRWISRREPELPAAAVTRLDELRTIEEPEARAAQIEMLLKQPTSDEALGACLDALSELPSALAISLLPDVSVLAKRYSPVILAKACLVTARFGFGELAGPLISSLPLIDTPRELLPQTIPPLLRALRWLGSDQEIALIASDLIRHHQHEATHDPLQYIIAAIFPELGDNVIDAKLRESMVQPMRLDLIRAIGAGASYADRDRGQLLVKKLFPAFRGITDSYGTCSHFCLSVLLYIESLVLAICDHHLANLNVLDPASQQLLGSGFAA